MQQQQQQQQQQINAIRQKKIEYIYRVYHIIKIDFL